MLLEGLRLRAIPIQVYHVTEQDTIQTLSAFLGADRMNISWSWHRSTGQGMVCGNGNVWFGLGDYLVKYPDGELQIVKAKDYMARFIQEDYD